jgi:two-component system phosphate regulon response regulator PhoB
MAKKTVLLIEDDPDIVELVQYNLERESFAVLVSGDGEKGLDEARKRQPDVIVLDLMLPGIDGLEVCRRLKAEETTRAIPIVMLTARDEEVDVVTGLELGADDYVPKPFSPRELVARIRAVLRRADRAGEPESNRREHAGLSIDATRYEARMGSELLPLTRAEFRLLWALVSRPGRVFTRNELAEKITAGESLIIDRNVDVHISSIRRKLGSSGDLIATVRGVGYKCKD